MYTLTSLTEAGNQFSWWVEEMPNLPYTLSVNDTLTLNIICDIVVNKVNLVIDTMVVETILESYTEIIAADSYLVSDIEDSEILQDIVVYPNPFTNQLNFTINNLESNKVSIQIFDISGKKVFDRLELIDGNTVTINLEGQDELLPGSYFYKITSIRKAKTGKLIRVD